jgi:uncharacterized protein YecT (DUF1311 family)
MRMLLLAAIALAISSAAAATPPSATICARLESREPPATDAPTLAQGRALAGCDSEALYYGENGPADFAKARLCAFQEDAEGKGTSRTEDVFAGQTILMQLYANGLGVKRDLDLATAYACAIDGAPAETESRVAHLQALKVKPAATRFDYCDDITSGLAGGFCAARDAEIAKRGRAVRTAEIVSRIPPAAQASLAVLRKAAAAYVDAHGGEVDESGTARAQMIIDDEEATREAFTTQLGQLVSGHWPPASAAQATVADAALNRAYFKALTFLASKNNASTVKPQDCRRAQRAWIVYRDSFVAFAHAATPNTASEAVVARLTQERTTDLTTLAQ